MSADVDVRWTAQLQRVQDLLSGYHTLSLVVLDHSGNEVTVPSGLPIVCGCASPERDTPCWRKRRQALVRVQVVRESERLDCRLGRYCFVSPMGIGIDDYVTSCSLFVAGSSEQQQRPAAEMVQELCRLVRPWQGGQGSTPRPMEMPRCQPGPLSALTEREWEVLNLLGAGLSNRELGDRLFISESTVKSHIRSLLQKLGLKNRTEAALYLRNEMCPTSDAH